MALGIAKINDEGIDYWGATPVGMFTLSGDGSYPAGGYAVTPQSFGMRLLSGLTPLGNNSAALGMVPVYNTTTGKVQIIPPSSAGGAPLTLAAVVTSTNSALTSNVGTVTAPNTYLPGQFVVLQGFSNGNFANLNGLIVQIVTASASLFTFNHVIANIVTGADTGTAQLITSPNGPITSGALSALSTLSALTSSVVTITMANAFLPGQFVALQGFSNVTAINGYIVQIITASATQFTFNFYAAGNTGSAADVAGTAQLVVTPNGAPITTGDQFAVTNTALTSNVASISAVQALIPGNLVMAQGLTNGTKLNGQVMAVISTSLTNALFKTNYVTANIGTGADAGAVSVLVVGETTGNTEVPAGTVLTGFSWPALVVGAR